MSDASSDSVTCFVLTRNGNELTRVALLDRTVALNKRPVIASELQLFGFSVVHREADIEYSVSIGDVRLASGRSFGPSVHWEDGHHFESARGRVLVHLSTRLAGSLNGWKVRAQVDVNVVPTKLGERRYEILVNDIERTAAGLIFDIVSKTFRGVRYIRGLARIACQTSHLELARLHRLWHDLSGPLDLIVNDPHLRSGRCIHLRSYRGTGVLGPRTAMRLAARGVDPRSQNSVQSVTVSEEVLTRTGDTVEHRVILWFLGVLLERVRECVASANRQISLIEEDREFRDVRFGGGPTLYEEEDRPKVQRLRASITSGRKLTEQIRRATRSTLFRDVRPQDGITDTPVFQHVDAYYRFSLLMRRYLSASLVVLEAGDGERMKPTSRLYEHWVYLRLAEAFQACGLRGGDIEGIVRRQTRHRFVLDLDDDVVLVFHVGDGRHVRLRYEPWILPASTARQRGEVLCRGAESPAPAWKPDVLVEFIDGSDVIYAVVVDSKYTRRIRDDHWSRVEKYAQIRTVAGLRQVVRQVWLAYPGDSGRIRCRDTTVTWTDSGPDRPHDEIVMGEIELIPVAAGNSRDGNEDPSAVAREFVGGLMRYVGFPVNS